MRVVRSETSRNFTSSLNGPAELPLQYNEICIEISFKKNSVLLSMRLILFEGVSVSLRWEINSNRYKANRISAS